jgi:formate hydrogenlyase transcriptional activator
MARAVQFPAKVLPRDGSQEHESGLFSTEAVLNLQKLIFAGSPLSEVLANIAQLVESQTEGMSCTPTKTGRNFIVPLRPAFLDSSLTYGPWL